jgi:hypothetical protein
MEFEGIMFKGMPAQLRTRPNCTTLNLLYSINAALYIVAKLINSIELHRMRKKKCW